MTIQVSACKGCNTRYLAKKFPFLPPTFLVEIVGRICSNIGANYSDVIIYLQCDRENCEQVKYLRNVYCVITNHSKDQDMQTGHKTKLIDVLA